MKNSSWNVGTLVQALYPELIAYKLRLRRFQLIHTLLASIPPPVRLLDVGGTWEFWQAMGLAGHPDLQITLLNRFEKPVPYPYMSSVVGDARAMPQFTSADFDLVFSNSVIEHVGSYHDQQQMAAEIQRIGQRYILQTPNRYFPIEPHFLFPGLQFLPLQLQIALAYHLQLGWHRQHRTRQQVTSEVSEIRLLSTPELRRLFPQATIVRERLCGLTKSFTLYAGFPPAAGKTTHTAPPPSQLPG